MPNEAESQLPFEWLALRCQAGEAGAFEDLIAVMERPLLYYATSLTGDQDAALDVLQDVWIKAMRGIRRLKSTRALRAWLYAITHASAVDRIRRDYARDKAEQLQFETFDEADEPRFDHEDARAVHQALGRISVKHREALVLHFLKDLSMEEIASVIGCSVGTVKSRIHYAKLAMKQILEGDRHGSAK